jgi:hypothetical protein
MRFSRVVDEIEPSGYSARVKILYAQIGYSLFNLFKDHVFPFHVGTQNGNIFDATVFVNLMKLYDMKNNFSSLKHFCSMQKCSQKTTIIPF